jgi:hypothetical protein
VPRARLVLLTLIAGCSDDDGAETKAPPPPAPPYLIDAAPLEAEPVPTPLPAYDPASGYHLDDAEGGTTARRTERTPPRERRYLQLMLKSTPSGAIAAVDGKVLGRTPLFWEGEFTGREREFTFVLPGYSMARYRFVPLQNGFVHGKLVKVSSDVGDGGVPEIPTPESAEPLARPERGRAAAESKDRPRPTPPPDAAPAPAPAPALAQDAGL